MSKREANASRRRKTIADAAMILFAERSYEATTLDDVAEAAGIGIATLYRYFPTKEELVVGFLGDPAFMADEVRRRPAAEHANLALGHAVLAFLDQTGTRPEESRRFSAIIVANPRPRARTLEWFQEANDELVSALAERLGVSTTDTHVAAMAWMAIFVLQRAGDLVGVSGHSGDPKEVAKDIMRILQQQPVTPPDIA